MGLRATAGIPLAGAQTVQWYGLGVSHMYTKYGIKYVPGTRRCEPLQEMWLLQSIRSKHADTQRRRSHDTLLLLHYM